MKRTIKSLVLGLAASVAMSAFTVQVAAQPEEVREVRRHAEELERHLMELREHGNREEARAVQAELQQVGARLREIQAREGERRREGGEAREMEVRELHERAREMEAVGREEAARELAERAEQVQRELAESPGRRGPVEAMPPLERELREIQAQARRLAAEGNRDGAREMLRRAEELRGELQERRMREARERGDRPQARRGAGPPPPEEIERRMHHIQVAMENLHAAGLHEMAEHLEQVAAEMQENLRRPGPAMDPIHHLQAQIEELRGAVRHLAERMEHLQDPSR